MIDLKEKFIDIYKKNIKRNGSNELLDWLCKSDFFVAPASSRYHSSYEGGLCEHSLKVFHILKKRFFNIDHDCLEKYTIISLLHDICKCNFYHKTFRNVKNYEKNVWEQVATYKIDDSYPMGHGEKSVFLIERYMKLNEDEAIAIRWHMGAFDDASKMHYCISNAFQKFPLCVKLHISDLESTYLYEK